MAPILWDLRYALRQVQRSPAFFLAATLLIAAGITVNTTVFSLIDAVILRHLAVHDPERLVQLFEVHPRIPARSYFEYGLLRNLREHSSTLTDVVGQIEMTAPITHGREVERIHPHSVTDDYFRSLGVSAALGRVFTANDDMPAVLSDAYWRRGFRADPNVIGQTIRLYNRPFAIVGVAPPSFGGTVIDTSADLWIPLRSSFNFASSGEFVGDAAGSVGVLAQKEVKLPAGGIERALLQLFRFEGVDERATFIIDPVVQDFLDAFPS